MRILIVDESMVTRQAVKRALHGLGLERGDCVEASDGEAALELVSGAPFDAVIVSRELPGIDGVTFTKLVRMRPELARMPIILTAGEITVDEVAGALRAGADDIVAKPFQSEQLGRKVRALLGEAAYRRDRQIIYNLARPTLSRRAAVRQAA